MGLRTLSQRAMVALIDLGMWGSIVLVWWAWTSIRDPNTNQIIALSILSLFVLAANWIARKVR